MSRGQLAPCPLFPPARPPRPGPQRPLLPPLPSSPRSQDRNAWNVIFGGHLLRLAYEHAFATAALHAGGMPAGA